VVGVLLSPQLTLIDEMVPSGSVAVKVAVTVCPVLAGLGETLLTVTVGALSFTVSVVVPEPGPALFVAVTVIVNILLVTEPVEE
jgi:hypothetical protein